MSSQEEELKPYEQVGVAMTCRTFDEYERMFDLTPSLLTSGPILDVAGGASSFVADAEAKGIDITAADPMYAMSPEDIHAKGAFELNDAYQKLVKLQHQYDWSYYGGLAPYRTAREQSLVKFAAHFAKDRELSKGSRIPSQRYVPAQLPQLPFPDHQFSLVLCSHFLFLYGEQFDEAFHEAALAELVRVCKSDGEARVYPLLTLRWERYPQLDAIMHRLRDNYGIECRLETSRLPFIPGSTQFLSMKRQ
ncbi:class I SAM-dependent methyltransferase [Paenibacillus koleovorans]|uniref:class I SAM-dependent methyltransferase n=1 Tax=Paenibacillus koleovorans TaxID=121608 RepID=UPI000FDA7C46|nr:class I SAM-dependent methyltransferase [Paenibacillus koleovorans]